MSGPKEKLKEAWSLIRKGLRLDAPVPLGKYLGCHHVYGAAKLVGGKLIPTAEHDRSATHRTIKYDMSDFLKSCVARYQELAGPKGANLRKATTPYVDEAMDYDVHATPAGGQPPPSGELGAIASKVLLFYAQNLPAGQIFLLN